MTADIVRINRRGLAPVAGKRRRATNKQIMAEVRSGFMHKCGKCVRDLVNKRATSFSMSSVVGLLLQSGI